MNYILQIPREILREILIFTTYSEYQPHVIILRLVCKKFRDVVDALPYWHDHTAKYFVPFCLHPQIDTFQDLLANIAHIAVPIRNWTVRNSTSCDMKFAIEDMQKYPNILLRENDFYIIDKLLDSSRAQVFKFTLQVGGKVTCNFYLFEPNVNSLYPPGHNASGVIREAHNTKYSYLYGQQCLGMGTSINIIIRQSYNRIYIHVGSTDYQCKFKNRAHIAIKLDKTTKLSA